MRACNWNVTDSQKDIFDLIIRGQVLDMTVQKNLSIWGYICPTANWEQSTVCSQLSRVDRHQGATIQFILVCVCGGRGTWAGQIIYFTSCLHSFIYFTLCLKEKINFSFLKKKCFCLLKVPRIRTKFGARAFSASGPTLWNLLPANLRVAKSISSFRKLLKTHFFDLAFPP